MMIGFLFSQVVVPFDMKEVGARIHCDSYIEKKIFRIDGALENQVKEILESWNPDSSSSTCLKISLENTNWDLKKPILIQKSNVILNGNNAKIVVSNSLNQVFGKKKTHTFNGSFIRFESKEFDPNQKFILWRTLVNRAVFDELHAPSNFSDKVKDNAIAEKYFIYSWTKTQPTILTQAQFEPMEFPSIQNVGIENLEMIFGKTKSRAHLKEEGFNGIEFIGVINGYANKIKMVNADLGIRVSTSRNVSLTKIDMKNTHDSQTRNSYHSHYGVSILSSSNVLLENSTFSSGLAHTITLGSGAHHNVISKVKAHEIKLDFHRNAPFQNVLTEIHSTFGSVLGRPFGSSGKDRRGPFAAKQNLFWGLNFSFKYTALPYAQDWNQFPDVTLVNLKTNRRFNFSSENKIHFFNSKIKNIYDCSTRKLCN